MLGVACSEDAVSASGQWLADAVPDPSAFDAAFDARRCKKGLAYRCPWTRSSNALPVVASISRFSPNAAHLLDRGLLMLMRFTHRRSPSEDSGFQGPDTRASSLPR
jgi:hypothetical protein